MLASENKVESEWLLIAIQLGKGQTVTTQLVSSYENFTLKYHDKTFGVMGPNFFTHPCLHAFRHLLLHWLWGWP